MSNLGAALIWCPVGSLEEAKLLAHRLIEEELVACANILPGVTSIFSYEGITQEADEVVLVCKTRDALLNDAITRLCAMHSYDVPAICGWRADKAPDVTLEWLSDTIPGEKSGAAN